MRGDEAGFYEGVGDLLCRSDGGVIYRDQAAGLALVGEFVLHEWQRDFDDRGERLAPFFFVGFKPRKTFCDALQIIRHGGPQSCIGQHFRRDADQVIAGKDTNRRAQDAGIALGERELDCVSIDGPCV